MIWGAWIFGALVVLASWRYVKWQGRTFAKPKRCQCAACLQFRRGAK